MSLINSYSQSLPQVSSSTSNTSAVTKSSVQSTTTITGNSFLDSIRLPEESVVPEANDQLLKQEDFFALLSQQLSMQDPFEPVDNDQMIAQMASFSTVDGISNLNEEILNLNTVMSSSQALQASGLVGRKVLIPSDTGAISAESSSMNGVISTPSAIDTISVSVQDATGQVIKTFTVDGSAGGNIDVSWDGLDKDGLPVEEGLYSIKASGKVDGESQDLAVSTYAHVSSVSLGTTATGAILNLRGVGGIKLSDVLAVSET
ncbi:flagellar hook assembly protein FlgD [Shewanella inventionis]|uniref:Basal-body rod modification protein FlgD n=1 Tax=Shewanella inventionis TaxID=1738770 RepID=A0ABQ1IRG1_9GAMM|nr:flagellar hook assembly protein FlgD [Shewanella inventionis]MCL1156710.1 flagellar hook assembly protein FlgD [Shewanella inventionis]UAL44922.1 flagellar hook assembly protein FlgD [Shewanella inventionis]GGB50240.1 basal-body rod modification protein FlgD [Shewanella inventionis]